MICGNERNCAQSGHVRVVALDFRLKNERNCAQAWRLRVVTLESGAWVVHGVMGQVNARVRVDDGDVRLCVTVVFS